jgi:hypothetical protein
LEPTTGQVTRSPTQWARERNLAKLDLGEDINPLEARFTGQNARLKEAAREMGEAGEEAGEAATRAARVARLRERLSQRRVSKLYEGARGAVDADMELPTEDVMSRYADVASDFENSLPADIRRRMGSFFLEEDPRPFTPAEVNKAIQLINQIDDPRGDKATRTALGKVREILTDTLDEASEAYSAESAEAFNAARKAAAERFRMLRPKLVQELLDDRTNLDTFVQRKVVGGDTKQVQQLLRFFQTGNERERRIGEQVLGSLQEQVDQHLYDKAVGKAGETFSGANYMDALKKIGNRKLEMLFGPEGAAKRWQFARAAQSTTTVPAGAPVNWSNTAPTLVNYLSRVTSRVPLLSGPVEFMQGMAQAGREAIEESARRKSAMEALRGGFNTPEYQQAMEAMEERFRDRLMLRGLLPPAGGLLAADQ